MTDFSVVREALLGAKTHLERYHKDPLCPIKEDIELALPALDRIEKEVAAIKEAVLIAHPDGPIFKQGLMQNNDGSKKTEFDFAEAIRWLGKEWGAFIMHECEPQEVVFEESDGTERVLEYVVGDGEEYNSPSGYTAKDDAWENKCEEIEKLLSRLALADKMEEALVLIKAGLVFVDTADTASLMNLQKAEQIAKEALTAYRKDKERE